MMETLEVFVYGLVGGVIPEAIGLYNIRHIAKTDRPVWLTSPFYWIITLVMVLIGAGFVTVHHFSSVTLTPLLAIEIGATAPLLLTAMINKKPATE